jgi:polysaccharide pyruvyl transferase WcaK-like protein
MSSPSRVPPERVKIGIFGMFGVGNIGNDASLEAMLHHLREKVPHARVVCVCPEPGIVTRRYRVEAAPTVAPGRRASGGANPRRGLPEVWPLRDLRNCTHALRVLRGVDTLIIPGTGILDDFGTGPRGMPYDLFRWCLAARVAGARVRFLSVGAGPICHPMSRWLMKAAVGLADYRSFRDVESKSFMASIGSDTRRDSVVPDLVFSLPAPAEEQTNRRIEGTNVGVGVMAYHGWAHDQTLGNQVYMDYLENLGRFVLWLLKSGYGVRLLIGEDRDLSACSLLAGNVSVGRAEWRGQLTLAREVDSMSTLLSEVLATDVVVATRYHNVVAALMAKRPVVSLGYAPKNQALLEQFGMAAYCQPVEGFDVELLKRQFLEVWDKREPIRKRIEGTTHEFRASLAQQFQTLFG